MIEILCPFFTHVDIGSNDMGIIDYRSEHSSGICVHLFHLVERITSAHAAKYEHMTLTLVKYT